MSVKRMRPSFHLLLSVSPEEVLERVRGALSSPECLVVGTLGRHGFELQVDAEHEHLWSPWLTVEVRPHPDGSQLFARFSPKPSLWTLYVALYAALAFLGLCGGVWGLAQLTLGGPLWALWLVPGAAAAAALLYLSSFVGQGLGGAQMYVLRRFLDEALPSPT